MKIVVEGRVQVANSLRLLDQKMILFLRRRMDVASELLREKIVEGLISGQWGIQSRRGTGGLAGSVHQKPTEVTETGVTGGVAGAGAPFQYGAYFQVGGKGPYQIVGKPVLAWPAYGKFQANTRQGKLGFTADTIFAKRVTHPAIKKAHWMTGPLQELMPEIIKILTPTDAQRELME